MYDEKDSLIRDISHKHTLDSVREDAYRELKIKYAISREKAQKLADKKFGDFWG